MYNYIKIIFMSNLDIYKNRNLTKEELYVINNEIEKIFSLNLDELDDENLIDKMFICGCEQNNIDIIKYFLPYIEDYTVKGMSLFCCLYFKYIKTAEYLFEKFFYNEDKINELENFFKSREFVGSLFYKNNHEAIKFLLERLYIFVVNISMPIDWIQYTEICPILIAVENNYFESVKTFLDFVVEKNDEDTLKLFNELENKCEYYMRGKTNELIIVPKYLKNYAFYRACLFNNVEMAKYFCEIFSHYKIDINCDNIIIDYYVIEN